MNNEKGFAIVVAICLLALMTLMGVTGIMISTTELKCATNDLIHQMEFYGADSAVDAVGPAWAEANLYPVGHESFIAEADIPIQTGVFSNLVSYTAEIKYLMKDGVILKDDVRGMPEIEVFGTGTHPRKGIEKLARRFKYISAYSDPGAPIHAASELLSIKGSPLIDTNGEDVPEVLYDLQEPDPTDVFFQKEEICEHSPCEANLATEDQVILWDVLRENALKLADEIITPDGSGHVDTGNIGSEDNPQVVFVDVGETPVKIQENTTGYGVLFIDGDVATISATITWHGVIIINGNVLNKINGDVTIHGSLFLNNKAEEGEEIEEDLTGNMTVIYEPDALEALNRKVSRYAATPSWRYVD